ncbi:MAG TPA: DinB family protein [Pyrinomonadaceae bacterium]|nr:DinB family protein [Pyrinomonadaceae bacterium]
MTDTDTLADLYRHMEWADAAVWGAVLRSDGARADAKLRELLRHLHLVQRAFLRAWRGEEAGAPYPEFDDAAPLMEWGRAYYAEARAHLASLGGESLSGPLPVPWASMVERRLGRPPEVTSLGETLLQVALHTTYHRGQVNTRLRELGGEPPLTDYIAWLWQGRPAPAWPGDAAKGGRP